MEVIQGRRYRQTYKEWRRHNPPIMGGAGGTTASVPGQGINATPATAAQRARPFIQAAHQGVEQAQAFNGTLSGAIQTFGPAPLPATGFIRRVTLQTVLTGGVAGTYITNGDQPFNFYNLIRFAEPNAAPVFELSGFNTLMANIYGGYAGVNDPRNDPDYVATAPNINIEPFVPVEIDMTAMGALSNLTNASAFRLTCIVEADTNIYSSNPTTLPAFVITPHMDYWTLPNGVDQDGVQQATNPPFPGTIQLWSQLTNLTINTGNNRTALSRMGNQLRTIIMVSRISGIRADTPFPNPAQLRWDDLNMRIESPQHLRKTIREYTNGLTVRDTGTYVYPYSYGITRFVGGNGLASVLPTVTATRYELSGSSSAAGTFDWIVNDLSSAPTAGVQRASLGGLRYNPPSPAPAGAM